MSDKNKRTGSFLDLALVAGLVGFCITLVSTGTGRGLLVTALLIGMALLITGIGIWREAYRESQLDEVEMAGNSFGARWGICAVILLTLLSVFLTPLQGLITGFAQSFDPVSSPFPIEVRLFVLGLICALALQLMTKTVVSAIWHRLKS